MTKHALTDNQFRRLTNALDAAHAARVELRHAEALEQAVLGVFFDFLGITSDVTVDVDRLGKCLVEVEGQPAPPEGLF